MQAYSPTTRFAIITGLLVFFGGLYMSGVFGDTSIGNTLFPRTMESAGSLVGHWTFDGQDTDWSSTTAEVRDVSGLDNHANASTTMSNSNAVKGVIGQGVSLNGSDEYLEVADDSTLDATAVTLAAWIKTSTTSGYIIAKDPTLDSDGFEDQDWNSTNGTWGYEINAGSPSRQTTSEYANTGTYSAEWGNNATGDSNLVLEVDTTGYENIQVDFDWAEAGTWETNDLFQFSWVSSLQGTTTELDINDPDGVSGGNGNFNAASYSLGANAANTSLKLIFRIYNDGAGNGESIFLDDVSITGDAIPAGGSTDCGGTGKTDVPYALCLANGNAVIEFVDSSTRHAATSTTDLSDGEWHHVLGTYDGETLHIYVDGELEDSNTDPSTALPVASGDLRIGADYQPTPANFFTGSLDDVRVYNSAVSAEEARRIYGLGATTYIAETLITNPTLEDGLVAHWTFDGGYMTAATATDRVAGYEGAIVASAPAVSTYSSAASTTYNVPAGVTEITIKAWGAGGGSGGGGDSATGDGGGGGFAQASLTVTPGEELYLRVGGGGTGGTANGADQTGAGGGGGGYSGIFRGSTPLVIAGGGGGSGGGDDSSNGAATQGGEGGGTEGGHGESDGCTDRGDRGTQSSGGAGGVNAGTGGVSLQGGDGGDGDDPSAGGQGNGGQHGGGDGGDRTGGRGGGGGGGGGYYGGGGGGGADCSDENGGSGGGGSGYVSGTDTTLTIGSNQNVANSGDPDYCGSGAGDGANGAPATPGTAGTAGNDGCLVVLIDAMADNVATRGVIGQAVQFDGVDDSITISDQAALTGQAAITLSGWVNLEQLGSDIGIGNIAIKLHSSAPHYSYQLYLQANDRFAFEVNNQSSTNGYVASTMFAERGRWYHVAGVWEAGSSPEIYIDGVNVSTFQSGTPSGTIYDSNGNLSIGSGSGEEELSGIVDDLRIYNRALSAEEVKRLYQLGATTKIAETITSNPTLEDGLVGHWTFDGPDMDWSSTTAEVKNRSGQGYDGDATTTMSSKLSGARGVIGQAMQFDGDDDVVSATVDLDGSLAMTLSFWHKVDTWTNGGGALYLLNDFRGYAPLYIEPNATAGTCNAGDTHVFVRGNDGGASSRCYTSPPAGVWHHYVVVGDITLPKEEETVFYLDGVEQTPLYDVAPSENTIVSDELHKLYIAETLRGTIDDVRFYNRVLSAEEIKRLYELGN
jgi:hypothetical protein